MMEDNIKRVSAAETEAEEIVANAKKEAAQIVAQAKTDAAAICEAAAQAAKEDEKKALDAAVAAGGSLLTEAKEQAKKDAGALRAMAETKKEAAVEAVMQSIHGDC